MGRIEDKIEEVNQFLNDLEEVLPSSLDEYVNSLEKKLACERAFEKIVESVNDLAILVIKERRFSLPDEDSKAFDILSDKKIISIELAERLRQAKGMRNFLAHQYAKIDDELVFEALSNKICEDVRVFIEKIV